VNSLALRLRSGQALRLHSGAVRRSLSEGGSAEGANAARIEPTRLLNRNFVLLSQAQLVSQFGNQAFTIALTFWTAATTQSATMTGLMLMAAVLPVVVLGPLTGTVADRLGSRLRIIVTCDLLSGAIVLLLALGFVAGPAAWRPAMLFTAALLIGVCNAFFDPAVNALAPDLVPRDRIEAATAFRQSARQVTALTAQGLGGMLFALVGPAGLFVLDGLSFLVAGATEMLVQPPPRAIRHPQPEIRNQSAIRPATLREPQGRPEPSRGTTGSSG